MNIFQYAASEEKYFEKYFSEVGYERKTTFFSDLSIAECYGTKAVKDTYKNVVSSWKNDVVYFTEFAMSLNLKSWEWYYKGNETMSKLYIDLYYKVRDVIYGITDDEGNVLTKGSFNEDGQRYFFEMTD